MPGRTSPGRSLDSRRDLHPIYHPFTKQDNGLLINERVLLSRETRRWLGFSVPTITISRFIIAHHRRRGHRDGNPLLYTGLGIHPTSTVSGVQEMKHLSIQGGVAPLKLHIATRREWLRTTISLKHLWCLTTGLILCEDERYGLRLVTNLWILSSPGSTSSTQQRRTVTCRTLPTLPPSTAASGQLSLG